MNNMECMGRLKCTSGSCTSWLTTNNLRIIHEGRPAENMDAIAHVWEII